MTRRSRSLRPTRVLRPTAALLAALLMVWSATMTRAASADEGGGPVLWQGVVRDASGRPVAGANVNAYARPPASLLRSGAPLLPVAGTVTSGSGDFTLRTPLTAALETLSDDAGWITVMVAAVSEEGISLALDSVAWEPSPGVAATGHDHRSDIVGGRWVTSPAEREAEHGRMLEASEAQHDLVHHERPRVLVLERSPRRHRVAASAGKPGPARGCAQSDVKDLGTRPVAVGELHLNSRWAGLFSYTNTKSTSFQAGFSRDGKKWEAAGSVSVNDEAQFGQEGTLAPEDMNRVFTYDADMVFKRFTWLCGSEYQYYFVETIEPTRWTGSLHRRSGGAEPSCEARYVTSVTPNTSAKRKAGSGVTLHNAISVGGFTGSVTSTVSTVVRHEYNNVVSHHRALCGSSDFITGITRVRSLA